MENVLSNKKWDFGFYQRLFVLTLPIIVQNLIVSLLNMMDTLMIGKLGEVELASVGIANQYFFMFTLMLFGINAGCSIFVSQFWGKHDHISIKKTAALGLFLSVLMGILFTAFAWICPDSIIGIFNNQADVVTLGSQYLIPVSISYLFTAISLAYAFSLRSTENTLAPMLASIAALLTNIVFNYMLIFGKFGFPAMGVQGAAIATVIARIIECIIIVTYVYSKNTSVNVKFSDLKHLNSKFIKIILIGMTPVLVNEFVWGFGNLAYNIIYARMGVAATASSQITTTIMNLFMIVIMGLGSSSMVVVGKEIGAGHPLRGKEYATRLYRLAIAVGFIIGISVFFTSNLLVSGFNMSDSVLQSSAIILKINAVVILLRTYNFIMIVGILRGGGDSKYAVVTQGATMWLIGIPLAYIGAFVFHLPIYTVIALCTIEELTKAIFIARRFRSDKWIHNLTH